MNWHLVSETLHRVNLKGGLLDMALSKDGSRVAATIDSAEGATVWVYQTDNAMCLKQCVQSHRGTIAVTFASETTLICASYSEGYRDYQLLEINLETGEEKTLLELGNDKVNALFFTQHNQHLVVCQKSSTSILNTQDFDVLIRVPSSDGLEMHGCVGRAEASVFLTGIERGWVTEYDIGSSEIRSHWESPGKSGRVKLSHTGRYLVSGKRGWGDSFIYDLETTERIDPDLTEEFLVSSSLHSWGAFAFSPDDSLLISGRNYLSGFDLSDHAILFQDPEVARRHHAHWGESAPDEPVFAFGFIRTSHVVFFRCRSDGCS